MRAALTLVAALAFAGAAHAEVQPSKCYPFVGTVKNYGKPAVNMVLDMSGRWSVSSWRLLRQFDRTHPKESADFCYSRQLLAHRWSVATTSNPDTYCGPDANFKDLRALAARDPIVRACGGVK